MKNNQKQIILSLIGIAVLVIAVVGVSFAFFTYSKNGTQNNNILTGKINFEYTGQNQLTLLNEFPKTATEAITEGRSFNFTVSGNIPSSISLVNYKIYAIAGASDTTNTQGKTRLDDSSIRLYLKKTSELGATTEKNFGDATQGDLATGLSNGDLLLASGSIAGGSNETHSYELYMWVDNGVTISDTSPTATYCASPQGEDNSGCQTGKKVYSNSYYSLKVKVEANDTVE